ncbi:MAG: hypothetical protein KC731_30200, partial [Myxococcales bacterium]|nr:hypothetical protein [Myxococcales bacterium]
LPLREATARLARGEVVDAEGQKAKWEAAPQVAPLTPRARAWFESYAYRQEAAKQRGAVSYRLTTPG